MTGKKYLYLVGLAWALLMAIPFTKAYAQEHHAAEAKAETKEEASKFNASEIIFGHVSDAHDWHFFSIGENHISLPLPIIIYSKTKGLSVFSSSKFGHEGHREAYNGYTLDEHNKIASEDKSESFYDFSITKNVLSMLIGVVLLLIIMLNVAKKYKQNGANVAPSGFQNALEPVIMFVRDDVAKPTLGAKYQKYMPLLLTLFFFIWINNMLGLLPGGANFTGNITVTACLALISFIVLLINANKHFWGHLLNPPGVPLPIKFVLVPIEIMSLFIKPIALAIRLFANILAGHIIILSIISLIFIFSKMGQNPAAGYGFSIVSLAFSIFMFFLELMVAAIQAFIFTNLTAVFIGQAIEDAHGHEEHDHHHEEATA